MLTFTCCPPSAVRCLKPMNCYVLAGGRSRRMGRSKPEMFLDRVVAAAREAFDEVIVVDRDFEGPHEGEGPVFGIKAALQHANRGRCFILAVDYPLITSDVLRYLRERGGVPVWRGKLQPLCAVYDVALLPLIESRIAAGRFDVRGLVQDIIEESELRARFAGEPLLNVNTPEDLQEAKAIDERVLASR
jgi:molybdopterin-guanine dinucleotide biosynthesis protein A